MPPAIPLRLETVSGAIDVDGTEGPVAIETVSGNVVLSNVDGPVTIGTVNGYTEIYDCPETLHVKSRAGDIVFDSDTLTAPAIEIESMSGAIDVSLPAGIDATIRAETVSGVIDTADADMEFDSETDDSITFISGNGDTTIHISTISGDITIVTIE